MSSAVGAEGAKNPDDARRSVLEEHDVEQHGAGGPDSARAKVDHSHRLRRRDVRSDERHHVVGDLRVDRVVAQRERDVDLDVHRHGHAVARAGAKPPLPQRDQRILVESDAKAAHDAGTADAAVGVDVRLGDDDALDAAATCLVRVQRRRRVFGDRRRHVPASRGGFEHADVPYRLAVVVRRAPSARPCRRWAEDSTSGSRCAHHFARRVRPEDRRSRSCRRESRAPGRASAVRG